VLRRGSRGSGTPIGVSEEEVLHSEKIEKKRPIGGESL